MSRSEIDDIFAAAASPPKKTSPKTKSHQPETVLDPSKKQKDKPRREKNHAKTGDSDFRDSRGFGHRRKTVEGYNIYKEVELGISTAGGDTPLCPFDCQCCF